MKKQPGRVMPEVIMIMSVIAGSVRRLYFHSPLSLSPLTPWGGTFTPLLLSDLTELVLRRRFPSQGQWGHSRTCAHPAVHPDVGCARRCLDSQ